ncbi:non sense mediated decay [Hyphodiscus hymeniophilus]|uniref:Non sense mediated decay n=1 Tax=Hyphodiscus hymeniophilus TaxID=353542 RepID=A0A9P6VEF2_9HELO|nr:non sense mediated decay [Hyphodiscus hymeniophilus]
MSDEAPISEGPAPAMASATDYEFTSHNQQPMPISHNHHVQNMSRKSTLNKSDFDIHVGGAQTPMTNGHRTSKHILDLDDYFVSSTIASGSSVNWQVLLEDETDVGPRDMDRHSKLPYFMQMHGSVLPRMILPLLFIGSWATIITCISKFVHELSVNTLLLTVLGFVVGLALSFRSTTAYERYSDGRKSWATLSVQSRNLARYIWVHIDERPGELGKDDLLAKLTGMNLILAFAVALKHKLRFEPYAHYADICSLVGHLDTFAKAAYTPEVEVQKKKTPWKALGEYLGLSFAESNPRKAIKRASRPLGNLPLEILTYMSSYIEEVSSNQTLKSPIIYGQITLTDVQSSAERVLTTPLPIGYNILISQIVLLYVYLLPFQLYGALGWITIPGTIAAAYIIIGLAAIGNELENPFGNDVNDLPLDHYCAELARELDIMTSSPAVKFGDLMRDGRMGGMNKPLWPLSTSGHGVWRERNVQDIRSALRSKVVVGNGGMSEKPGSSSGTTLEA